MLLFSNLFSCFPFYDQCKQFSMYFVSITTYRFLFLKSEFCSSMDAWIIKFHSSVTRVSKNWLDSLIPPKKPLLVGRPWLRSYGTSTCFLLHSAFRILLRSSCDRPSTSPVSLPISFFCVTYHKTPSQPDRSRPTVSNKNPARTEQKHRIPIQCCSVWHIRHLLSTPRVDNSIKHS